LIKAGKSELCALTILLSKNIFLKAATRMCEAFGSTPIAGDEKAFLLSAKFSPTAIVTQSMCEQIVDILKIENVGFHPFLDSYDKRDPLV